MLIFKVNNLYTCNLESASKCFLTSKLKRCFYSLEYIDI